MNAQPNRVPQKKCRKPLLQKRFDDRSEARPRARHEETLQLIYAHFPPAVVLGTEHHLRVQTQIEQRAQQLWFARRGCPESAQSDWLQAEREVVQNLCAALLHRNLQETEPGSAGH